MSSTLTAAQLAKLADDWSNTRRARLALQKQVDDLQADETKFKERLVAELLASGSTAIGGTEGTAKLVHKKEPTVTDWDALWGHIKQTGEFELLYRRMNAASVKERWEAGETVPGVQSVDLINISWSKNR
jgi:hypothetical protein